MGRLRRARSGDPAARGGAAPAAPQPAGTRAGTKAASSARQGRLGRAGRGGGRAGGPGGGVAQGASSRRDLRVAARLARRRVLAPGCGGARVPPRRRRVDRHAAEPRPALDRRHRGGTPGAVHPRRPPGPGRALAPPLARARGDARGHLGAARPVPRGHPLGRGRRPRLQLHARGGGRRLRPAARRDRLGGLRESRPAVARARRRRLPHAPRDRPGDALLRDGARGATRGPPRGRLRPRRTRAGAPPSSAGSPRRARATRSRCGTCSRGSRARTAAGSSIVSTRSSRHLSRSRGRVSCAGTRPSASGGGTSWGSSRPISGRAGRRGGATPGPARASAPGTYQLACTCGRIHSS